MMGEQEITQELRAELDTLKKITENWTVVRITRSLRTATVEELCAWLDDHLAARYYFDTWQITVGVVEILFENPADAEFFRMSWERWE